MPTATAVYVMSLVSVCILCYYNSFQCGFVFDDMSAIKDNKDLRPCTSLVNLFRNDFWGTPMHKEQSHKSYRPLCVLTFRWNYFFHQLEPMGYHLVNVLLHAVVCILYFRMSCLFIPTNTSMAGAILFAVHPIHTEAVTGIVGRAEILSSIFFLASILFYIKSSGRRKTTVWRYQLSSMFLLSVAMLCKEQGITAVGVMVVYELFVAQRLRIRDIWQLCQRIVSGKGVPKWTTDVTTRLLVLFFTTMVLLLGRVFIMGAQLPVFTRFDNPAASSEFPVRHMTYSYLWTLNSWLLLFPCDLCCDWTMGSVPLVNTITDPRNVATLVLIIMLILLGIRALVDSDRQRVTAIFISVSLTIVPFLPASNIFFPVGFVVAERVLYIPSMGFCMLVAQGWGTIKTNRSISRFAWFGMAVLLVSHGCKTIHRNNEWESEHALFMSGLRVNQRNAKLFNNMGHVLEGEGKYHEALEYFQKAVRQSLFYQK